MVISDRHGFVQKFNPAFAQLVGWSPLQSPPATKFKDLLTRPSQYIFGSHVLPPLHLTGIVQEIELDIVARDGSTHAVVLAGRQLNETDDDGLHYFCLTAVKARRAQAREQLAARALLERKQEYLDLAEKLAQVGHWHADLENGEVFWSPEVYAIHGREPHTMATPTLEDAIGFYHEDDRAEVRAIINAGIAAHEPFAFQKRLTAVEGRQERIVEAYGLGEYGPSGEAVGIFGVLRDVTASVQAQKDIATSEERYRLLADNVPGMIGYWDSDMRCRFANQAYIEWFGREPDAIVGITMLELVGEDLFSKNAPYIYAALAGERQNFERALTKPSGEVGYVWAQYLPDIGPTGEVRGFYAMLTDVSELKQRNLAEQESNILKTAVLSSTHYLVIATTPDGVVTMFNAAAQDALGYSAEEVIGKRTPAAWHDPTEVIARTKALNAELGTTLEPGFVTFVAKAGRTGSDSHEWTYIAKDGRRFPVLISVTQLRGEDGTISGYLGVVEDITDKKNAEEALRTSEATFRTAMENASIGMTIQDPSGRWLRVNKALAQLLGYTEAELLEQNFRSITHPDDLDKSMRLIEQMLSGELDTYTIEKRYLRKDGSTVWAQLNVSAVHNPDGSPQFLVAQVQDITERREIERVKNELISTVSHELRTPVTSIRGALGLLAGTLAPQLPEQANKLIDIANKNSERLILLVNDMLDIDKIASGRMQFDMALHGLDALISVAIEDNAPYAERFGVSMVTQGADPALSVEVDPARFQQVMSNLLSNAAKFSPQGGQVNVIVNRGDGVCRIAVRDHGQGISAAFAPLVFGKFSQADSSATRSKYGSGLGLHISREIIVQMGGAIGFDSEPNKGATFWIELPLH